MLLTEFDTDRNAVINPDILHKPVTGFPETVVSIFSHHLFQRIVALLNGKEIARTKDVDGIWPVYEAVYRGHSIALYKARLGAPACVGCFEDIIPMGTKWQGRVRALAITPCILAAVAIFKNQVL